MGAAVLFAPLLLEDVDLAGARLLEDLGEDRGLVHQRGSDSRLGGAVAQHQHLAELDRRAGLAGDALDNDHVVGCDAVLLAAGADDSEHRS